MKESVLKRKRIEKFGKYSKVRAVIREELIKLAQYLREEKESYKPVTVKEFHKILGRNENGI